jgi:hypothetical protein
MKTLKQRFDEKVSPSEFGCWLFIGATSGGYGSIKHKGKSLRAHRVSYELHFGEIPEGMHVMHKCDNPACVNPQHLSLGTHLDNMRDMYSKGRRKPATGMKNGAAKITESMARRIVSDKTPSEALGKLLGVSGSRVRQIRREHQSAVNF